MYGRRKTDQERTGKLKIITISGIRDRLMKYKLYVRYKDKHRNIRIEK